MKKLIKISKSNQSSRIDKLFFDICKDEKITRTKIQDFITSGNLTKNGIIFKDNSYRVKFGEEFILNIPKIEEEKLKPTKIPLDIVYEDNDVIVINKSAGLTTHPGAGNNENTLANALLEKYKDNLSKIGGEFRPGIVHRLDKDTSGLMVVAKNDIAHENLKKQLEERKLKRIYVAFLWGTLNPKNGKIEGYIERSKTNKLKMEMIDEGGRYSLTNYKTIKTFANDSISMVEFNLDTGRTHQIRVHCSWKGCPLVGDRMYGGNARHLKNEYSIKEFVDNFPRQALHSYKISFFQPTTNELKNFEIELPLDMQNLYDNLVLTNF